MTLTSPTYLRTSLAAAMTLGLRPGLFFRGARLHCLNLLLTYGEGCQANCSYCGLSRDTVSRGEDNFIRVEWPTYTVEEIVRRSRDGAASFERVCLSMIMHPRAVEDTIELTERLNREIGLPVSVLVNPSTLHDGDLEAFHTAGADMATVAIDAATPELFEQHRGSGVTGGHRWDRYWQALEEAALVFGGGRIGAHLIAGLGETERELVALIQKIHARGGQTHLFSFYPEQGSKLRNSLPCPSGHFRRIQLARFLIDCNLAVDVQMEFDELARITGFGVKGSELDAIVSSGEPFMTSGCPGETMACACNRPFGDGPPGDIRSFPFQLEMNDIQRVQKQLATYMEVSTPLEAAAPQG